MGGLATTSSTPFRVGTEGNTSKGVGWVKKEYGVDIARMGHYSAGEVRALAIQAKEMKLQADFAKQALQHIEKIIQYRNEINRLRMEATEKGLKGKEEVDKYVLNTILKTHGHEAHIQKIFQDMRQGMALIDANSRSDQSLSQETFQGRIRVIMAKHQHSLNGIRQSFQSEVGDLGKAQRLAQVEQRKRQKLMSFIRADDYQPTGNGSRRSFSNWFS